MTEKNDNICNIKNDKMRYIIWSELLHTVFWEQYLSQYCSHKKDWNVYMNTTVIVLSSFGTIFSCIWKLVDNQGELEWMFILVFASMLASQIAALYQRNIYLSPETETKIRKLRLMYLDYRNDVERIWIDLYTSTIDGEKAEKEYYELRKRVAPLESLKDELNIKEKRGPMRRGNNQAYIRLSRKFGSDIPKEEKTTLFFRIWDSIIDFFHDVDTITP